jgi:hypothetical protein
MRATLAIAAIVFALSAAPAFADGGYTLDAKGKCHDGHGKFAKASFCIHHTYKLDAKGACHDEHGKFASKALCHP